MKCFLMVLVLMVGGCVEFNYKSPGEQLTLDSEGGQTDTAIVHPNCNREELEYKTDFDFGPYYAEGPYGFKGSLCYEEGEEDYELVYINNGDVFPNICLPSVQGNVVCMAELVSDEYDFIVVDFSATWCGPCMYAAMSKEKTIETFANEGLDILWVTILLSGDQAKGATYWEAYNWADRFNDKGVVLYDEHGQWYDHPFYDRWSLDSPRGFPAIFFVSAKDLKLWDSFSGWAHPSTEYYDSILGNILYRLLFIEEEKERLEG